MKYWLSFLRIKFLVFIAKVFKVTIITEAQTSRGRPLPDEEGYKFEVIKYWN